jgi:predicted DNA-binding protein (MmcQ/YjbR family)
MLRPGRNGSRIRFSGDTRRIDHGELNMDVEGLRKICLSFPGATEQIQWGDDLLFKVGGKMFAVTPLEPAAVWLSLKATPELFAEFTERPGIIPAPYLARAKWIALESSDAVSVGELSGLLRMSYDLVVEKLPRKVKESLLQPTAKARTQKRRGQPAHKKRRR